MANQRMAVKEDPRMAEAKKADPRMAKAKKADLRRAEREGLRRAVEGQQRGGMAIDQRVR